MKRKSFMESTELLSIRTGLKLKPMHMYRALGIPRRTYQDYESGRRGIPLDFATRVREMFPTLEGSQPFTPEPVSIKNDGGGFMVEKREQITLDKADVENLRLRAENAELKLQINVLSHSRSASAPAIEKGEK